MYDCVHCIYIYIYCIYMYMHICMYCIHTYVNLCPDHLVLQAGLRQPQRGSNQGLRGRRLYVWRKA